MRVKQVIHNLTVVTLICILSLMVVITAEAATVNIAKTGQTNCYDANGSVISCTNTGQDGDVKAGVGWITPRFTDNSNGTITDRQTGLIWLKDGNCFGAVQWTTAISNSNSLASGQCGLSDGSVAGDWHLANINELESLVKSEVSNSSSWLNAQGFTNIQSDWYMSSNVSQFGVRSLNMLSTTTDNTSGSYYFLPVRSSGSMALSQVWKTGQTESYASRDDGALRSGVAWPSPRFTEHGDCVKDNLTGLMWTKDANIFDKRSWANAYSDANNLRLCGYTDWRLPDRKEFLSLFDRSAQSPPLPTGHPFDNVQYSGLGTAYWTSTTYYNGTSSCAAYMTGASIFGMSKENSYYVWPVRGGQTGAFTDSLISVSSTYYDFSWITPGTSSDASPVLISNPGASVLNVTAITLSDTTNYTLNLSGGPAPCGSATPAIATGQSCTVTVTYNPLSTGTHNATLSISYSGGTVVAALNGTETASAIVDYTIPFLHTNESNVIYCVASNFSMDDALVNFYLKASSEGLDSTQTSDGKITATGDTAKVKANSTRMVAFRANSIVAGTDNSSIGSISDITGSKNTVYIGGILRFTRTTSNNPTQFNCENLAMMCFQGASNPKRNVTGVICRDHTDNTYTY